MLKTGEHAGKYSSYDDKGMPTTDKEGNPLPKSALKKLDKIYKNQQKLHDTWNSKGEAAVVEIQQKIASIESTVSELEGACAEQ